MEIIHKFEAAGLGKAPFKCIGMHEEIFTEGGLFGGPPRAGGSCHYCGTGIRYAFDIKSSDGKFFHVGSDCIHKLYVEFGNSYGYKKLYNEVETLSRAFKKKAAEEKLTKRLAATKELMEKNPGLMTNKPHPNAYYASTGKTFRDYAEFLLKMGGASGKNNACKMIEKAMAAA